MEDKERKVPVSRLDSSLIEQEFGSIREKFEFEMRKMEEEMSRFRGQLTRDQDKQGGGLIRGAQLGQESSSSSRRSTTTTTRTTRKTTQSRVVDRAEQEAWLEHNEQLARSPLIADSDEGCKVLKLRFDVSEYKPEQIVVKTANNRLQVEARREEKGENVSMYREYNREFLLPDGIEPDLIRSWLSADGVLTVEAPLPGAFVAN